MRDFSHPPGLGSSREIHSFGRFEVPAEPKIKELVIRIETIQKCGLIADIRSENGYVTLYATRRVKKGRRG